MENTTISTGKKYIINPAYNLKEDINRVIIATSDSYEFDQYAIDENNDILTSLAWKIHPVYALFFSFFDGKYTFDTTVDLLSSMFNIDQKRAFQMIAPYIENKQTVYFNYKEYYFGIPKNFIIQKSDNCPVRNFDRSAFISLSKLEHIDLTSWRLNKPLDLLFVVNNICTTNCIYCYANKDHKVKRSLPFTQLEKVIEEAKMLKMRSFDLTGGELFLYKDWYRLLETLKRNHFNPNISTKTPLDETTVSRLKYLDIKAIQISLDTINKDKAKKILNVDKEYIDKIKNTIELLDKANIEIRIKSVITKLNAYQHDIKELLDYLTHFENIKSISIAPGEYSLYKDHSIFDKNKVNKEVFNDLKSYFHEYILLHKQGSHISFQGMLERPSDVKEERQTEFNQRAFCTGNMTALNLLPDGQVTICEQLYWHPDFIIGDVNKQSILEIWNSEKALELANLSKATISQDSTCKDCMAFDSCRHQLGVCWKLVVAAYGKDKIHFPDPRCPIAPPLNNERIYL